MANYSPETTNATIKAEEALLGAILLAYSGSPEGFDIMAGIKARLYPSDFYGGSQSRHGRIFQGMCQCYHPDQIMLSKKMQELGILQDNDIVKMSMMVSECPCWTDYRIYAKVVLGYAVGRAASFHTGKGDYTSAQRQLSRLNKHKGIDP